MTLNLIDEATSSGSRHAIACDDMEIDVKTFKRWKKDTCDKRRGPLSTPGNKLSDEEVADDPFHTASITGMTLFMNSSKSGTVKALSPCDGL